MVVLPLTVYFNPFGGEVLYQGILKLDLFLKKKISE